VLDVEIISKMDFKNIIAYGLVKYSHPGTCAKPQHTHQNNGHLFTRWSLSQDF
jgi:hypothetical protein